MWKTQKHSHILQLSPSRGGVFPCIWNLGWLHILLWPINIAEVVSTLWVLELIPLKTLMPSALMLWSPCVEAWASPLNDERPYGERGPESSQYQDLGGRPHEHPTLWPSQLPPGYNGSSKPTQDQQKKPTTHCCFNFGVACCTAIYNWHSKQALGGWRILNSLGRQASEHLVWLGCYKVLDVSIWHVTHQLTNSFKW